MSSVVKKEKKVVSAVKPRVPLLRSKTPKKRKAADSVDLEIFEGMSSIDAIRKLQALANLGLDKFVTDLEDAESTAREALEVADEQRKINQAKSKVMEKDAQKIVALQTELEEVKADVETKFKTFMEGAKRSAAITILKAIQLVKQVTYGDFDLAQLLKDQEEWQNVLAGLTREGSSKVAEQADEGKVSDDLGAEEEKQEVAQGDEGISDQA